MDQIARQRAHKAGNSKLWSVTDALEDTIERIKKGELKPTSCVILLLTEKEDRSTDFDNVYANVDPAVHVALVSAHLHRTIDDWIKR